MTAMTSPHVTTSGASRARSRRDVLAASAGLVTCVLGTGPVRGAQPEQVIVSTQGGDYARLLNEIIDAPLMRPGGIDVVQDIGEEPVRAAKLYAGRNLTRGVIDVSSNSAAVDYRLADAGLLEPLNSDNVPNLVHVLPELRAPFIAPQFYSPQVLVYNPAAVPVPPGSFAGLLDRNYRGKVGFPVGSYFNVLLAASLLETGSPNEIERAKPLIERLNSNGLRLYPTVDSIATAFASGEIVLCIMAMARAVMWRNAGINIAAAFPHEGCIIYVSGMVVPRVAPNKANAFRYLNAMLEPTAQLGFAARMGYLPSVDNAPLEQPVAAQLSLPDPKPRLVVPDYAYTTRVQSEINDWWIRLVTHS
jgi:putative spermidine/putrescine transport system substrate-binding protein